MITGDGAFSNKMRGDISYQRKDAPVRSLYRASVAVKYYKNEQCVFLSQEVYE